MMKKNVGTADRIIRLIIAAVLAVLYFTHTVTGILGIILVAFSVILIITTLISFCGLYTLFGINTCPANTKSKKK